jgi:copper transport protein
LLRVVVAAGLAGALVVVLAVPASAHAILESTSPADGSVISQSPSQVTMTFNENVEIQLGAVRLFTCSGSRIDIGAPRHASATDHEVVVSVPHLSNGTYLVSWRVISAYSHPVHGGFTFTVGQAASQASCTAATNTKTSTTVGVLFAIDRVTLFTALALLIGGGVFLILIARGTSAAPLTWLLACLGWALTVTATVTGVMLQGPYGEGTGLGDAFKWSVVHDILHTHYGAVAEWRLVLLALAIPALLYLRRATSTQPLPPFGLVGCGALAVALAATPGMAGHADTGSETFLALPLDTAHVLAMCIWLGGLVALLVGALGGTFSGNLRRAITAFSQLALASVLVLVISGLFASWRQVGFTIKGYTSTSYGNILLVKLAIVATLIAVAAVSRSIVHQRQVVPLGAPDSVVATVDERTVGGLRRSVGLEVALGLAVLITTALLVNAQPAKSAHLTTPIRRSTPWIASHATLTNFASTSGMIASPSLVTRWVASWRSRSRSASPSIASG